VSFFERRVNPFLLTVDLQTGRHNNPSLFFPRREKLAAQLVSDM
jgi:hypothetical protein